MQKQSSFLSKKVRLEYRHYSLPVDFPAVALLQNQYPFPSSIPADPEEEITYLHFHNCLEIGYCLEGRGDLYVEGRLTPFTSECMTLVLPYAAHISRDLWDIPRSACSKWEFLYVDVKALLSPLYPDGYPNERQFLHDYPSFQTVLRIQEHPGIGQLLRQIFEEMRRERSDYQTAVRGLLLAFLVEVSRVQDRCPSGEEEFSGKQTFALAPAVSYVHQHYREPVTPAELAQLCHLSLTHFRRLFKGVMGCSPLEYLHFIRIQRACERLYASEDSILEISMSVGYDSLSGFNRHFSAITGSSPSQWRKERRTVSKKEYSSSVYHGE